MLSAHYAMYTVTVSAVQWCTVHVCVFEGCTEQDLLSLDEDLCVDEVLRFGLTPLDVSDIDLLNDTQWVTGDTEQQLRLDHHVANRPTNHYYRPL